MRLLFVNSSLSGGGSERAMVNVANMMAKDGHEVHMLLLREKPKTYAVDEDVRLIQLKYPGSSKLAILPSRLWKIRKSVKVLHPDCVVSFMWDINVMTLIATIGVASRVVVSERADPSRRSLFSHVCEFISYRFADSVVYQTEFATQYCPKSASNKAVVIPNVVDQPLVAPFLGLRSKRIVTAGRLTEQKNQSLLIHAFAEFSKNHRGYVLELYGDGPLEESLKSLVHEYGVEESVHFMGFVDNLAERINDAMAFVLSSDYEGISNAMTESMALGLPVVCTDCPVGGARMMIDSGKNGLLVPVGDVDALASALSSIADNPLMAEQLGNNARAVTVTYSSDVIGKKWKKTIGGL